MNAWPLDRTFDYEIPDKVRDRVHAGIVVRCRLGNRRIRAVVVNVADAIPDRELASLDGIVVPAPVAPPSVIELLEWTAQRYAATKGATYKLVVPPRVRVAPKALRNGAGVERAGVLDTLTGGDALARAVAAQAAEVWAVRVGHMRYVDAVADLVAGVVAGGTESILIAVPEVGPTADLIPKLVARISECVRIDSATNPVERSSGLIEMATGRARVAVGGRAAVFAAVPRLAALVVVEERHPAHKEERAPRYEARRVALERARRAGALCVLLGATPQLETAHAVRVGEIRIAEEERARARDRRPVVELVPMPAGHPLSPQLMNRLRRVLKAGERAALVTQERGFVPVLWCAACRRSLRCPECDSALAFDRAAARVRCPRCGHTERAPNECPTCGSTDFRYLGAGAERLEEQLSRAFPRARVARLDADAPEAVPEEPDLYITTWYGTKEAIRPPASFVAVLNADALVRRADFRAAEDAHHAFSRMAEWAGPAAAGGVLLLQTQDPGHHAIQAITRGDYWYYAERELEIRKELRYPPFVELIRIEARGREASDVLERAADLARRRGASILGPVTTRVATGSALEMLVKCDEAMPVAEDLRDILATVPPGTRLRVDVDPR